MVARGEAGLGGDEKCKEIKKYRLVVTKQSQGCGVQHREYSQRYRDHFVKSPIV